MKNSPGSGKDAQIKVMLVFVFTLHSTLLLLGATSKAAKPVAASGRGITIKAGMTLADFVVQLRKTSKTSIVYSGNDGQAAQQYVFPAALAGKAVDGARASTALTFLTTNGWEGSKLPEGGRVPGKNYELARTPFQYTLGSGTFWSVCNNRMWDWKYDQAKKRIVILRRLKEDGDLVMTQKFRLSSIDADLTLGTLLDVLREKTGVYITNVLGEHHVARRAEPLSGNRQREIAMPMTAGDIPMPLRERLLQDITIGEFLCIITVGLNQHTATAGGDWKWSSSYQEGQVVYTLRDYGHVM